MLFGIKQTRAHLPLLVIRCSLLLIPLLFSLSCGKKGPLTLKAYEKPAPPSGLSAVHRDDRILLSWTYPGAERASIEGFHILRAEKEGFERLGVVGSDTTSYVDRNYVVGSVYRYKVLARSARGVLSDDSEIITVTPGALPSPPEEIRVAVGPDFVELTWSESGKGVCYNVYRRTERAAYRDEPVNREAICATFFKDPFLTTGETVSYAIRALLNTKIKDEGRPSREVAVSPSDFVPSAPSDLRFAREEGKIYLSWKESPEPWVRGYRVCRKAEGEPEFAAIGEVRIPAFTDTVAPGRKVRYRITALGPSVESSALDGAVE